jgi:shikimate dehydrogenase
MSATFLSILTGSFSRPAGENPTVAMMEAAYRHHGINARYINMEVGPEQLGEAVRGAKAQGYVGFNCSLPNKVEVIQYLDGLGESSKIIGAVNCAVNRDGKWIGENTDGKGFLASLAEITDPKGKQVVLFGAGGASRAIAVELVLAGAAKIILVNRDAKRGQELADLLKKETKAQVEFVVWSGDYAAPAGTDIVVNATSIGLAPDVDARIAVDLNSLKPGMVVADVIPNPPQTRLLREAAARGCTTLDGLGMLVNQGATNFEYWLGVKPDKAVMRRALEEIFGT